MSYDWIMKRFVEGAVLDWIMTRFVEGAVL